MFERIITTRLVRSIEGPNGGGLSDRQYGFREGRSTVDAIKRVRFLSESMVEEGRVVLAISLDIANAFNSLPHNETRRALAELEIPCYLQRIIGDYLSGREIVCSDRDEGRGGGMPTAASHRDRYLGRSCGTSHMTKSLGLPSPLAAQLYATLTTRCCWPMGRNGSKRWKPRTSPSPAQCALGLRVSAGKTEAIFLHNGTRGPPPAVAIKVEDVRVQVGASLKYLGLHRDGTWRFEEHLHRLTPRLDGAANALSRLMPNLGGPRGRARRLYANVINSIAMYGAPIWSAALARNRKAIAVLNKTQRRMAIRAVRGYRTISHAAATLLAGMPPIQLLAKARASVYERVVRLKDGGGVPVTARVRRLLALQLRGKVREDWRKWLEEPNRAGRRTVQAILPHLDGWIDRPWARASYRTTQVLTGHGCFGEYLQRIRRDPTPQCQHCSEERDSAQHTLDSCPAWAAERRALTDVIGGDLSLRAVIKAISGRSLGRRSPPSANT
ncbi:PREDICTED: uncharacterized protein LOC105561376 [Vollenhovia emeryi]|uniref:uncharacterized protein LOC105561376 n=1 Tax=Vollenhovia emeryi TaxID=411798 RepID=UPI0005F46F58|nr:PREDICTED: uncharacterized protein LOC105561376 [Vollenhovia emeryi]